MIILIIFLAFLSIVFSSLLVAIDNDFLVNYLSNAVLASKLVSIDSAKRVKLYYCISVLYLWPFLLGLYWLIGIPIFYLSPIFFLVIFSSIRLILKPDEVLNSESRDINEAYESEIEKWTDPSEGFDHVIDVIKRQSETPKKETISLLQYLSHRTDEIGMIARERMKERDIDTPE